MKTFLELYDELNEKPKGLYYYINKKRKEGRKMRKKGEKGAPKASDFERAAQTAKESVKEDGHTAVAKVKSDIKDRKSASEYLLLIASKQKINLGKDIDFDNMKKLLYDIPTSNWTKQRISYTVVK